MEALNKRIQQAWDSAIKDRTTKKFLTFKTRGLTISPTVGARKYFPLYFSEYSYGYKDNDKKHVVKTLELMGVDNDSASKWFDKFIDENY